MGEDDLIDDEDDIGGRVINIGSPFAPPSPPSKSSRKQLPVADGGAVPNGIDISGSASRVLASGRSPVASPEKEAGHRGSSSSFKRGGLPPQPSPTVSASSLRRDSSGNSRRRAAPSQPLSEAALREQEMLSSSSPQAGKINARNVRGYRGFFDKTRDVPNLIDAEDSESMATETTAPSEQAPGPAYGMTAAVVAGQRSAGLRTPSSSGSIPLRMYLMASLMSTVRAFLCWLCAATGASDREVARAQPSWILSVEVERNPLLLMLEPMQTPCHIASL